MKSLTKFHQNPTNLHTLNIHLEPFKVQLSEVFIKSFVVIKLRLEVSETGQHSENPCLLQWGFSKCSNETHKMKMILPCPSCRWWAAVCGPLSIQWIITHYFIMFSCLLGWGFSRFLNVICKTKMILPYLTLPYLIQFIQWIIKTLFYNLFMPSWMGIFKMLECNTQNKNDFT